MHITQPRPVETQRTYWHYQEKPHLSLGVAKLKEFKSGDFGGQLCSHTERIQAQTNTEKLEWTERV